LPSTSAIKQADAAVNITHQNFSWRNNFPAIDNDIHQTARERLKHKILCGSHANRKTPVSIA